MFAAERQYLLSGDLLSDDLLSERRSRSAAREPPSWAVCAASRRLRKRIYKATATHTTTNVLALRIRNQQIIRTTG
jgi:hypothetical protein